MSGNRRHGMLSIPAQLTTAYQTYDEGDDIVCSVWRHTAGVNPGMKLTTSSEHISYPHMAQQFNMGIETIVPIEI